MEEVDFKKLLSYKKKLFEGLPILQVNHCSLENLQNG
jgi:hypothetical protein